MVLSEPARSTRLIFEKMTFSEDSTLDLISRRNTDKLALLGMDGLSLKKEMVAKIGVLIWTTVVFPTLP